MAIKTFTISNDYGDSNTAARVDTSVVATVTIAGTTGLCATLRMPWTMGILQLAVPTLAASTAFKVTCRPGLAGATAVRVTKDVDGVAYPRSAFTGNTIVTLLPMPGSDVVITASNHVAGGTIWAQARRG